MEVQKWIKKDCCERVLEIASEITPVERSQYQQLRRWLRSLDAHLLHTNEWTVSEIGEWGKIVTEIQSCWCTITNSHPFPKLHMLRHSLEFAERHRFLGRASEQQVESFHHTFNDLYNNHHHNQTHRPEERIRRCLADTALRAIRTTEQKSKRGPHQPTNPS